MFHVEFDVEGYDAEDLSVRVHSGRCLVLRGLRRQTDAGRTSTTEFCRKIRLPDDVDLARLDCWLQPGGRRVTVEGPRKPLQGNTQTPPGTEAVSEPPLNVPVLTTDDDDQRRLSLLVEVM